MSGTDNSNEDLTSGRWNRAQDPTTLIGGDCDDGIWSAGAWDSVLHLKAETSVSTGGVIGIGGNGSIATGGPPSLGGPGVEGHGGPYLGPGLCRTRFGRKWRQGRPCSPTTPASRISRRRWRPWIGSPR